MQQVSISPVSPIEYFFGEEFNSEEIQDLIFIIRRQSKENQHKLVEQTKMLLSLSAFQQIATNDERDLTDQELNDVIKYIIQYADEIESIYKITSEIKKNIKNALKPG